MAKNTQTVEMRVSDLEHLLVTFTAAADVIQKKLQKKKAEGGKAAPAPSPALAAKSRRMKNYIKK